MANRIVLVVVTWLSCACAAYDVHEHMTLDEVRSTFHVDGHHLVPEYEIVPVHHVRRRSVPSSHITNSIADKSKPKATASPPPPINPFEGQGQVEAEQGPKTTELRLKAFGVPFNLSLVPTEGLFKKGKLKVWSVEPNATAQHGVEYIEHPESNDDIGEVYQDENNQAAILLRKENGELIVEGSIGPHIVIRPIPARLRNSVKIPQRIRNPQSTDDELFLDSDGELGAEVAIDTGLPLKNDNETDDIATTTHHHIVFKRKDAVEDTMSDYAFMEPDHLSKRYRRSTNPNRRNKREAPYTIYPEILVIVDYDGYRLHGGDNSQIKRYFVSFWNGVDMRYKLLKGPKIRVSIAGIIISRGRDATPYLERNRVGRDAIDSAAALTDMGKYLFRERRLPVYDIAVAITKLDMCRRQYPNDNCNRGTAGFAYVGGACVVNKRLEKVNSVAIIEDTGGFSGIIVAAHEVGHLLGAVHDGSPPPSYLGGPGAEKCKWTDGFIMSDLRHTERGFRWSSCSVASFHHFLNGDTATCLYNAPHEDESLPRVLPGKLLTLDAQCRRDRGTSACFKDERVCAQLFCFDSGSGYCVAYRPAAEGSACGDGQYCINGQCIAEHENIIPDYSQNTPSYVRPNANQGRPLFHEHHAVEEDLSVGKPALPYQHNDFSNPNYFQNQGPYQNDYGQMYFNENNNNPERAFYNNPQQPYVSSSVPSPSTRAFSSGWFSISTTKSPYDFKDFGKDLLATAPLEPSTTQNPFASYFATLRQTKNPYDFGDFGKKPTENPSEYDNVNNNYLKRSYNVASYFGEGSDVRNKTVMAPPQLGK